MASVDVLQLEEKASVYAWEMLEMVDKSSDYVLDDMRHMLVLDTNTACQQHQPAHQQHSSSPSVIRWQHVPKSINN